MADFEGMAQAVLDMDGDKVEELVGQAVKEGATPEEIIDTGLIVGMEKVGVLFKGGTLFIPEVLAATQAMKKGLAIVDPLLKGRKRTSVGLVVLGTVQGDIHDIGRSLVGTMLEASGFEVIDLGNDVAPGVFVQKVSELSPQIIGMSALLTNTMPNMKVTIDHLKEAGVRDQVKIIVGGSSVSPRFAEEIGSDGTAIDAVTAVDLAKSLLWV